MILYSKTSNKICLCNIHFKCAINSARKTKPEGQTFFKNISVCHVRYNCKSFSLFGKGRKCAGNYFPQHPVTWDLIFMSHSIRPEVNNFKFGFTFLVRHEENSCHERFSASFAIFMARTENNGLTTSLALYNVPLNVFGHLGLNTSLAPFLARTENYEINSSLPNSLT